MGGAQVLIVSVDGAIASGKTTLIKRVVDHLEWPVVVAKEPVEQWAQSGLLDEMYKAITRRNEQKAAGCAITDDDGMPGMFQVYAFSTRLGEFAPRYREAQELARRTDGPVVLITERSVYSDRAIFKHMLQEAGYITDVQSRVYDGCFEAWERVTERCRPDVAVWLDTPPDACMQRQKQRARHEEDALFDVDSEARAYANALHKRHVQVFEGGEFEGAPVLRLDGRSRFRDEDQVLQGLALAVSGAVKEVIGK